MEGRRRRIPRAPAIASAAALVALGAAGCGGGGETQASGEPSGTFTVRVLSASFPERQRLGSSNDLSITVRNDDRRAVPDLAVTITSDGPSGRSGGFTSVSTQSGIADALKPTWIVNRGPGGGQSAYVGTWATGPLGAGETRTLRWNVSAARPGSHTLRFRVDAGLAGRARAQTADNMQVGGTLRVYVASAPGASTVDPETGEVVRGRAGRPSGAT